MTPRILSLRALNRALLARQMLLAREAITVIERSSGKRYDPWVVDAFVGMVRGKPEAAAVADAPVPATGVKEPDDDAMDDMMVQASDLATGMVLSRDLMSPTGLMMLPAGHVIDTRLIDKMQQFEKTDNCELTIYVKKPQPGDDA